MTFKELHSQLQSRHAPRLIAALLMILFAAGTQTVLADDVIRVTGKVISKEKRKTTHGGQRARREIGTSLGHHG